MNAAKVKRVFFLAMASVFFVATVIMGYVIAKTQTNAPPSIQVSLGNFGGRILSSQEVHKGTFSIERPFEQVYSWGQDAIISYENDFDAVIIHAWRPDLKTPGVFEHSQTSIACEWNMRYIVGKIVVTDHGLLIAPKSNAGYFYLAGIAAVVILTLVTIVCSAEAFSNKSIFRMR